MPTAWSTKRERQYEKIKQSSQRRGVGAKRATEIAARTVNKQRRQQGETPQSTTQGTGNPNQNLESRSRDELYNLARELDVSGRSKMTKSQLVKAIRDKR